MKFTKEPYENVHYEQLREPSSRRRRTRNYTILVILIAIIIFIIGCLCLWRLLRRRPTLINNPTSYENNSSPSISVISSTIQVTSHSSTVETVSMGPDLLTTQKRKSMGICASATWATNPVTVAGGRGSGSDPDQLKYPRGAFVDDTGAIYITDDNLRVMKWKPRASGGVMVAGFGGKGNKNDQFELHLHNLAVDQEGTMFICDSGNRRVMRWEKDAKTGQVVVSNIKCFGVALDDQGSLYVSDLDQNLILRHRQNSSDADQVVAGGNGKGAALNQFDRPHFPFVDHNFNLFVPDTDNQRIMKWPIGSTEGIIVSEDHTSKQLSAPHAVVVDEMETIYIVDHNLQQVIRWFKGAKSGQILFGGRGYGYQPNQFAHPIDIDFDREGNLYITDRNNHRIQMFSINKTSCHSSI